MGLVDFWCQSATALASLLVVFVDVGAGTVPVVMLAFERLVVKVAVVFVLVVAMGEGVVLLFFCC